MVNIETVKEEEAKNGSLASRLNWLRAAVLGANDGIISVAALVVGVAGASVNSGALLVTGISGLLAGACSMAVGEFVSVSSQRDTEKALLQGKQHALEHKPEEEFEKLISLYERRGLKQDTARKVAEELTEHDAFAAHAHAEFNMDPEDLTNPLEAAIASALSFSTGALVPILAITLAPASARILTTFIAVLVALLITGILSAQVSGARAFSVTVRVLIGGMIAMGITLGVGHLFGGIVVR